MKTGITLITMGAGNVLVLKETLKSFQHICDEVIYGDLLLFHTDREIVQSYQSEFNLKIVPFKFDYLFQNGFSSLLNILASHATNDVVMYMNTSEVVDEDYGIVETVNGNPQCNTFFFTHLTDLHRWYRCYNRHELKWSGRIHEQLEGEYRPYHRPIFQMADLPKDMGEAYKAFAFDTCKECVYFHNYMSFIDNPEMLGATDPGWIKFATENYDSMKERLVKKGLIYEGFRDGDFKKLRLGLQTQLSLSMTGDFKSSTMIEYQNDPQYLNKK